MAIALPDRHYGGFWARPESVGKTPFQSLSQVNRGITSSRMSIWLDGDVRLGERLNAVEEETKVPVCPRFQNDSGEGIYMRDGGRG